MSTTDVGAVLGHQREQPVGVARLPDHVDACGREQTREALTEQDVVVGDRQAQGHVGTMLPSVGSDVSHSCRADPDTTRELYRDIRDVFAGRSMKSSAR